MVFCAKYCTWITKYSRKTFPRTKCCHHQPAQWLFCVCVCGPAPHIFITKHILCHWLGAVDSLHCVFKPPCCFVINILSDYSVSGTSTGCRSERTIGMGLHAADISWILIEVTYIISPQNIPGVYHIPVKTCMYCICWQYLLPHCSSSIVEDHKDNIRITNTALAKLISEHICWNFVE